MVKPRIRLLIHNVRSAYNVGSLLRSAEGLAVEQVYLSGYTPYPSAAGDSRLPHLQQKISRRIDKTALGAQDVLAWGHIKDPHKTLADLSTQGFMVLALEQTAEAKDLTSFRANKDCVLIVGNEVDGIDSELLKIASQHLQIPMLGHKESFNVAVAGAIALYHLRFISPSVDK